MSIITNFFNRFSQKNIGKIYLTRSQWQDFTTLQHNTLEQFQHWTFKAIDIKAKAVASLALSYQDGDGITEDNQLIKDLKLYNEIIGYKQAIYLTIAHLSLTGACYWYTKPSSVKGYKFNFYPLNPQKIKTEPDKITGIPIGYIYSDGTGKEVRLNLDEVVVIYNPDPRDWLKAFSPLQASRYPHNIVELSMKYTQNVFGNMGAMQGFMIFEDISGEERQKIEEIIKEKYTGTQNAGKIGVINKKFDWKEITKTPADLDFLNSHESMRDTILAIQGIPKDMVIGGSTYENAKEAQRIFQLYTVKPLIEQITEAINRILIPKYNLRGQIIFENPVKSDKKTDTETIARQYQAGIITLNEARTALGYTAVDNGESFITTPVSSQSIKLSEDTEKELKSIIQELKKLRRAENSQNREEVREKMFKKTLEVEDQVKTKLSNFFELQKLRILPSKRVKSITANTLKVDWLNEDNELTKYIDEITQYIVSVYQTQAQDILKEAELTISEEFRKKIEKEARQQAQLINETTRKDLTKLLAEAINNDLSIQQLTENIQKLYEEYSISRAETIARTEVARIKCGTQRNIYAQSKSVEALEWLTARDSQVRKDHMEADGQVVPKGQKFRVGGEWLEYPGDTRGRPANIINCRCDVLPVLT